MHGMFVECGMPFKRFCVIDNRTDATDAKQLIREASCIFLMGGHAPQQFRLICEKGIAEEIRNSSAVILGVSAGSSNMAKRALDIWESHEPYVGLGLADITIKAHVTPDNQELVETLLQISKAHDLQICAMEDDSAIFVKGDDISYLGNIRWISKGDVQPYK
jgi:cyanophycinase-like exopeptidase